MNSATRPASRGQALQTAFEARSAPAAPSGPHPLRPSSIGAAAVRARSPEPESEGDWVEINAGGTPFLTTRQTLGSTDSLLARLAAPERFGFAPRRAGVPIRLDRSGELFGYVLEYLRVGKLPPELPDQIIKPLRAEAQYFDLADLYTEVKFIYPARRAVRQAKTPLDRESAYFSFVVKLLEHSSDQELKEKKTAKLLKMLHADTAGFTSHLNGIDHSQANFRKAWLAQLGSQQGSRRMRSFSLFLQARLTLAQQFQGHGRFQELDVYSGLLRAARQMDPELSLSAMETSQAWLFTNCEEEAAQKTAMDHLLRAIELHPDQEAAHALLAMLYARKDHSTAASHHIGRALGLAEKQQSYECGLAYQNTAAYFVHRDPSVAKFVYDSFHRLQRAIGREWLGWPEAPGVVSDIAFELIRRGRTDEATQLIVDAGSHQNNLYSEHLDINLDELMARQAWPAILHVTRGLLEISDNGAERSTLHRHSSNALYHQGHYSQALQEARLSIIEERSYNNGDDSNYDDLLILRNRVAIQGWGENHYAILLVDGQLWLDSDESTW